MDLSELIKMRENMKSSMEQMEKSVSGMIDTVNRLNETLGSTAKASQIILDIKYNDLSLAIQEAKKLKESLENVNQTKIEVEPKIKFSDEVLKRAQTALANKFPNIYEVKSILTIQDYASVHLELLKGRIKNMSFVQIALNAKDHLSSKLKEMKTHRNALKDIRILIAGHDKVTAVINNIKKSVTGTKLFIALSSNFKDLKNNMKSMKAKELFIHYKEKVQSKLLSMNQLTIPLSFAMRFKDSVSNSIKGVTEKVSNFCKNPKVVTITTKIAGFAKQLKDFTAGAASLVGGAAKTIGSGILSAAQAIGNGVSKLFSHASAAGGKFEEGMGKVAVKAGVVPGGPNSDYGKLSKAAQTASPNFTSAESTEALNELMSAGYSAGEACQTLPSVLNLASASGLDFAAATKLVSDGMGNLGEQANSTNVTEFTNQLAATAQNSNTSLQELGQAIQTVGGMAGSLSGGSNEMNTMLGILADSGLKGAAGGEALKNVLTSLQSPSSEAAQALKSLGVDVTNAKGELRPMNDVLTDFKSSLGNLSEGEQSGALAKIFNPSDIGAVNALLGNSGKKFNDLSSAIGNSQGAMDNMADMMNDTLSGRMNQLNIASEKMGVALYSAVGNSELKNVVKEAGGWLNELTQAADTGGLEGFAGAIGGVAEKAVTKLNDMAGPLVDAGKSIITNLLQGIRAHLPAITSGLIEGVTTMLQGILELAPDILLTGVEIINNLLLGISEALPNILTTGGEALNTLMTGISDNLPVMIETIATIISTFIQYLTENMDAILNGGFDILFKIMEGLTAALPEMIPAIVNLIMAFGQYLIENLPSLIENAGALVGAIVDGIVQALPALVTGAVQLVDTLINAVKDTDWLGVGSDILNGIVDGLVNGIKYVGGKIKGVADSIVGKFKSFLGIKSPSRVMKAEVGFHMGTGIAAGLEQTQGLLNNRIKDMSSDMTLNLGTSIDDGIDYSSRTLDGSHKYSSLDVSKSPVNGINSGKYPMNTANSGKVEKHYHIDKLFEQVTLTGEADENRLIRKIMTALANDIDETAENMGEVAMA